jgi:hypothetical protein
MACPCCAGRASRSACEIEQEIAAHRIEAVLARTGGKMDERGFITFDNTPSDA